MPWSWHLSGLSGPPTRAVGVLGAAADRRGAPTSGVVGLLRRRAGDPVARLIGVMPLRVVWLIPVGRPI